MAEADRGGARGAAGGGGGMTLPQLHLESALADPTVKAEIIELVYRNVADWAWPAAYTKLAPPEEWRKAVRESI